MIYTLSNLNIIIIIIIPSVDASVHTRSRRRLNFGESQRFKGKTFFLDLLGYPRAEEIEKELTCRGAVSVCLSENLDFMWSRRKG